MYEIAGVKEGVPLATSVRKGILLHVLIGPWSPDSLHYEYRHSMSTGTV
jgi:hypothetical protein